MKFKTNHSKYFKEWRCGDVRIVNDVCAKVFYHYEVQKFDGTRWNAVRSYRTLAEAKAAAEWILDDMREDAKHYC